MLEWMIKCDTMHVLTPIEYTPGKPLWSLSSDTKKKTWRAELKRSDRMTAGKIPLACSEDVSGQLQTTIVQDTSSHWEQALSWWEVRRSGVCSSSSRRAYRQTSLRFSAALPAAFPLLLSRAEQLQDKPTSNLENSSFLSPATFWEIRQDADDANGCVSSLSCTNLHFLSQLSFTLDKKKIHRGMYSPTQPDGRLLALLFHSLYFIWTWRRSCLSFVLLFPRLNLRAFGVKKARRVAFCHVISTHVNSHKVLKVTALFKKKKNKLWPRSVSNHPSDSIQKMSLMTHLNQANHFNPSV